MAGTEKIDYNIQINMHATRNESGNSRHSTVNLNTEHAYGSRTADSIDAWSMSCELCEGDFLDGFRSYTTRDEAGP